MNNKLDTFLDMICGKFDNEMQCKNESKNTGPKHPKARHIIGLCNDKIINLPKNFEGYFVIEESYYEKGDKKVSLPHLFLYTLNQENKVVLTSYCIPENINKATFTNNNKRLILDFNYLKPSEKFTPLVYDEENGEFFGESVSEFSKTTKFTLSEKITPDTIFVNEIFEKDGKRVMGFDTPIIFVKS